PCGRRGWHCNNGSSLPAGTTAAAGLGKPADRSRSECQGQYQRNAVEKSAWVFPLLGTRRIVKPPPFPGTEHPFSSIFGGSAAVGNTCKRNASHFVTVRQQMNHALASLATTCLRLRIPRTSYTMLEANAILQNGL